MPFRRPSGGRTSGTGGFTATLRALAILVVIVSAIGGIAIYAITSRGLSAHDEPSRIEELIARAMRRWATPETVRNRTNPVQPTDTVLADAMGHFADHCASCHANDGSGRTSMGQSLYPKAPDMRAAATQSRTDGELFSIIEHGIRLTGMPGWGNGTPEGERDSWALVHFIRRLPKLTEQDIERMERMNPKSPDEWRQEEEERRFLAGEDVGPSVSSTRDNDDLLRR
jgi:mono/diheme cytochrome c family protein